MHISLTNSKISSWTPRIIYDLKCFKGALRDQVIFFLKILYNILNREKWVKLHLDFFMYENIVKKAP